MKIKQDKMQWHCIDCHSNFQGPKDHTPVNGCERRRERREATVSTVVVRIDL